MRPAIEVILAFLSGNLSGDIDIRPIEERVAIHLDKLPIAVRKSINQVYVQRDRKLIEICSTIFLIPNGCIDKEGHMYLNHSLYPTFNRGDLSQEAYAVVYHEGAHLLEVGLTKEGQNFKREWIATMDVNRYYDYTPFKSWYRSSDKPGAGFMEAYGNFRFEEDVATFVEPIAREDYSLLAQLIDSKSAFYEEQMGLPIPTDKPDMSDIMTSDVAQEWAVIYKQKLDLLYKYGFITERDYRRIPLSTSL